MAALATGADFDIWVLDDRQRYANRERFPTAERILVGDIGRTLPELEIDSRTYCLIVTRGHSHDEEALYHLGPTQAGYVGMIGSKRKIKLIYEDLIARGVAPSLPAAVVAQGTRAAQKVVVAPIGQLGTVAARQDLEGPALVIIGEVAQLEKETTGKPKIVGLAADLVSRVAGLADGGQILLTRSAFNEARQFVSTAPNSEQPLHWVAHGPYRLRGADEAIEIFEVGVQGIAPLHAPGGNNKKKGRTLLQSKKIHQINNVNSGFCLPWKKPIGES